MRNTWLRFWVIGLLGLTALLFIWHRYGMNRLIAIDSDSDYPITTSDDRDHGGSSVASYQKAGDTLILNCNYSEYYAWPYCHLNIHVGSETEGIDLSLFDHISLDIRTSGGGSQAVRVFLRNYNPAYSIRGDLLTLKPSTMQYIPNNEKSPVTLPLSYFQIATWWINEYLIPPQLAAPDISNVTIIQISTGGDMVEATDKIYVKSIQLHGKWISRYQMLVIVLALWMISAVCFLAVSFWQFYTSAETIRLQKRELEQVNMALELEREELKALATHDTLTGAQNRVALRDHLYKQAYRVKTENAALSAIFMDLDALLSH